MHAVTGAYAKPIFVDNLGASPVCSILEMFRECFNLITIEAPDNFYVI